MIRLIELLYMMLPIYVANMAPPFVKYWRWWNRPISKRWLGSHKTVLGFFLGIAAAILTTLLQSRIHWQGDLVCYKRWFLLGLACGCCAMIGDSLKSYLKRTLNLFFRSLLANLLVLVELRSITLLLMFHLLPAQTCLDE